VRGFPLLASSEVFLEGGRDLADVVPESCKAREVTRPERGAEIPGEPGDSAQMIAQRLPFARQVLRMGGRARIHLVEQ
jgi:hypothetical protein